MVKRCQWGLCNTDDRYPERLKDGVKFIPFPKPKRKLEKCKRWIKLCGRPHDQLNVSIADGNKHLYVCTKHFVEGEPTEKYPDPLPAISTPLDARQRPARKAPNRSYEPPKKSRKILFNISSHENVSEDINIEAVSENDTDTNSCKQQPDETSKDKVCQIKGEVYIKELKQQERLISIWNELLNRAKEKKSLNKALKAVDKINKRIDKAYVRMQELYSTLESMGIQFHITDGCIQISFDYDSKTSILRLQDIYHSGELQRYLQDGLITEYVLEECGKESMTLEIYIAEEEFVRCLAIAGMGNRMEEDKTDSAGGKAVDDPETQEVEDAEGKTDCI